MRVTRLGERTSTFHDLMVGAASMFDIFGEAPIAVDLQSDHMLPAWEAVKREAGIVRGEIALAFAEEKTRGAQQG